MDDDYKPHLILTESHKNMRISVSKYWDFYVQLSENPSTGYLWEFVEEKPRTVLMVDSYFMTDAPADAVGCPGVTNMKFKQLVESGEIKLLFNLRRPWEEDIAPLETITITLIVEE